MERRVFGFLLVVLFFILYAQNSFAYEELDYNSITGKAVSQQITLSINITGAPPSINLLYPKNSTYLRNESLYMAYIQNGAANVWFNIDNGQNITLFSTYLFFNVNEGSHTINLFANNSEGLLSHTSVTFFVNLTAYTIIYDEFKNQGSSTDFLNYSLMELENLPNVKFEVSSYGKIEFYENINITNINSSNPYIIDFDSNINILQNEIFVNTTVFPNLNKKAKITVYNIDIVSPRILIDGEICLSSDCKIISHNSDTLVFNASRLGLFTFEEIPSLPGPSGGSSSGGGGGDGGQVTQRNIAFYLDKDEMNIKLKQGETIRQNITITNNGSKELIINVNESGFNNYIRIDEKKFTLKPGQSKVLFFDFFAFEFSTPKTYLGKLIFSDGQDYRELLIGLNIQSRSPLFDVSVEILKDDLIFYPGENLVSQITIYNLGDIGKVDVLMEYSISDYEGNVILTSQESLAVETKVSFVKKIMLPKDISEGRYSLNVRTLYGEKVASANSLFHVKYILEKPKSDSQNFLVIIFLVLIVITVILVFLVTKRKRRFNRAKIHRS